MTASHTSARRAMTVALLTFCVIAAAGCGWASRLRLSGGTRGSLRLEARAGETTFQPQISEAIYLYTSQTEFTALLIEGDAQSPDSLFVVRVMWVPIPARTPIAPTATNAAIKHVRFGPDGKTAVYSGAGFVFPGGTIGGRSVSGNVWDSDIVLSDWTEGYDDPIGRGVVAGKFSAKRDDARVEALLNRFDQLVTARLGYPTAVDAGGDADTYASAKR